MNIFIKFSLWVILDCSFFSVFAQIPIDLWDRETKERYTELGDYVRAKMYKEAKPMADWLIANHPDLHPAVYSKAIEVYEELHKVESKKSIQNAYEDSVLSFFDKKIKYFKNEAKNLNLKGLYEFPYWEDRRDKQEIMYYDYQKIIELNATDTHPDNVRHYMSLLCRLKGKTDDLDNNKIKEIYEQLRRICDFNIEKFKDRKGSEQQYENWHQTKVFIINKLRECVGS